MAEEGEAPVESVPDGVSGDVARRDGRATANPSGRFRYDVSPVSPVKFGLGFALVAALISIQPLASTTYVKLFYERGDRLIQQPLPEDVPIPHSLIWPPSLYSLIGALGSFASAAVLGLYVVFGLCFLYGLLRALNPTFRITTGVDWDRNVLVKTYMHSEPITKAFLIAIAGVIPAFILWQALGWLIGENSFSVWLRLAIAGAAFWLLFSNEGVAGDYESPSYEPPHDRAVLTSLLVRGALAGTTAWILLRFAPLFGMNELFAIYRSAGYIGPGEWYRIAGIFLGFAFAFGFAAGGIAAALGAPGRSWRWRTVTAALPAVVLTMAAIAGRVWLPDYFRSQYDFVPGTRLKGEDRLARSLRLDATATPRTAYLLDLDRALAARFSGRSVTEIPATPENGEKLHRYLERHNFRTALSFVVYNTLHDCALLQWSPDEALRVYLENLKGSPDMGYVGHLLNKLQNSAFTPTATVLLAVDQMANDRLFDFSDRRAWVQVGDLYARFGARAKAEDCYRRAEMPASQVALRIGERVIIPSGQITGRLLVNGKPVAGGRVGLMSQRGVVELGRLALPGTEWTSPFWLSWIGASSVTDTQGRFTLDRLLFGRYVMVAEAPGAKAAGTIRISRGPGIIALSPSMPMANLGDIGLTTTLAL